ncbi:chemotaxis-specific protein-glutamate methyltransferase CheB [Fulvivirga maritima]|uniref:chemotaxis-specific protein-glutamate methyltransferase CheB n=1 Tax=Fulvivirga maritima TaxID=2904247 RepID=UPI001F4415C2|nr:chemotaxis-specific protein-glutamate methyltransferase CheB [Fulvivirga maritima]UII25289.1 chemotaxis-specific protein-glutamate methyltransferase CheB [Fulvivirga maritima]
MIKALIVEDSGFMRIRISDVLRSAGMVQVVGTAKNGDEGLKAIKLKKPDVVITDMVMPEYDGLYLVKNAMKQSPVPIIVLSSLERKSTQVFEALALGAFEFLDKPKSERGLGFNKPLIDLVKAAVGVDVGTLKKAAPARNDLEHTFNDLLNYEIVAVGASTGGPGAIETFLKGLPANFPVPIVIAQHMPQRFIESFALRLNALTNLNVKVAQVGERLQPNYVYLCSGEFNTEIMTDKASGHILFGKKKRKFKEFNDPSVDCLFLSVAEVYKNKAIAVIMTGMGKDGMEGICKIKEQGGLSIAQNEKSCVVYGMPKAVVDAKAADYVVHIDEIPGFVTSCFS